MFARGLSLPRPWVPAEMPVPVMVGAVVVFGAAYGASLGAWHSVRLAMYVAVKLPAMLLITAAITTLFNWVLASMCGVALTLRRTLSLTLTPLAVAAMVLASVAPIALFFARSLPPPDGSQRTLHNLMYLAHTLFVCAAGYAGTSFLGDALVAAADGDVTRGGRIRGWWIAAYAFVAGEVGWALRPFVGSVYLPVEFLRHDALRGNVYEFVVTDILPHLIRSIF